MEDRVTREAAEHYLRDVDPMWRAFWFHMHMVAKNLEEFRDGMGKIDDSVFEYHARSHDNDFSRWVREVVGDGALAERLERVMTRQEALSVLTERVAELKAVTE